MAALAITSCASKATTEGNDGDFDYTVDRFADVEVLRYKVPDFDKLTPQQRILVYYLTEAALTGRDMIWDQNGKYNLAIRDLIENVYQAYDGDRESADFKGLETYLKQIEFANGITTIRWISSSRRSHANSLQRMWPNFPPTNSPGTSRPSMR